MPGWPDITSGVPQVANDAAQAFRVNRASARSARLRNLACRAAQRRAAWIGVLFVGNKGGRPIHRQDVVRLRALLTMPQSALENARLLRETRTRRNNLEN